MADLLLVWILERSRDSFREHLSRLQADVRGQGKMTTLIAESRRVRRLFRVIVGRMLQATAIPILLWLEHRLRKDEPA